SVGGFVIRPNKNRPSELSEHSFGLAVDINSKENPNIKDFPKALVKGLTGEDLFKGPSVETVKTSGKIADVLPAVKKLYTASKVFRERSKEMFKDEKSFKTELIHYLQGQRVSVKEDAIDKLFKLIEQAYENKKRNEQKEKKS